MRSSAPPPSGSASPRRAASRPLPGPLAVGLLLLGLLCPACTRPNPEYQAAHGAGADAGTAGEPDSGWPDLGLPPDAQVSPRTPARFAVVANVQGDFVREDVPFTIEVTALDARGAPTAEYAGTLRLQSTRGDVFPRAVEIASNDAPSTTFRFPIRLNREGSRVVVQVHDGVLVGESLPIEVRHGHWRALPSPVFSWGATGAWDGQDASMAEVHPAGDGLLLLYRGHPTHAAGATGEVRGGIGRADSTDGGLTWTRAGTTPLFPDRFDSSTDFDNYSAPTFLVLEGGWKLWFTDEDHDRLSIGQAISTDGAQWNLPVQNPALAPDGGPPRPERWLHDPCVLAREGGGYEMWYSIRYTDSTQAIGRATSDDGLAWTPDDDAVLRPGAGAGTWDSVTVAAPSVIRHGTVYRMWYAGDAALKDLPGEQGDAQDASLTAPAHLGYATSQDGVHWEKSPDNPVLSPSGIAGAFDQYRVEHPAMVLIGDEPVLFFSGFNGYRWRIGRATRPME